MKIGRTDGDTNASFYVKKPSSTIFFSFLFLTLKDYDVSVYWRIVCIKTNNEDPTEFGYPLL